MCTRSASERIDVRASLMSSLRISRSGPSNGLTGRPEPDGFDVCAVDTWSFMNSLSSRLSLILSGVMTRVLQEEELGVISLIGRRPAPRWCPTPLEADALTTHTSTPVTQTVPSDRPFARGLIPAPMPVRFLDDLGHRVQVFNDDYPEPSSEQLVAAYSAMVIGRRFDIQATALAKQGRLAVYPPSRGQEACQIASVLALSQDDWAFPTYRDSMALVTRGLDPVEVLTVPHGSAHCGYDPRANRTAPQCTPLATQLVHAVGFASGEKRKSRPTVAMAFVGDGGTSEGDFHEALNFAAVFKAPVVFLVQNNKYAISVPLSKQTAAPSLGYKGIGNGIASEQVDGNDAMAVLAVLNKAVAHARSGQGPVLVEAHTYRLDQHRSLAGARVSDCLVEYREHGHGVVAVDLLGGDAVADSLVPQGWSGGLLRERDADGVLVVLAEEHHRGLEHGREVERLVEVALAGGAVADERHRNRRAPLAPLAIGEAGGVDQLRGQWCALWRGAGHHRVVSA